MEGGEQEVKRILKNSLMKLVANAGYVAAKRAVGSASIYGYHQPKEPKIVDRLVEKRLLSKRTVESFKNVYKIINK